MYTIKGVTILGAKKDWHGLSFIKGAYKTNYHDTAKQQENRAKPNTKTGN
ncbi:hypothetical protein MuYL_3643 [Mucilaginibacter xinganensis]|uniref:Uncharacterized protein n=1 Tax=Mucilaginibacter xinganensis TaxID=1234841 RepID=A0A223P113_9SPHI|nr:hypothetical protein MuYL_3643 [Mucilaginibacter xinganensis]